MPTLDVSGVLLDPRFSQTISVTRKIQTVGSNGLASYTETTFDVSGVLVSAGQPFARDPDMQREQSSFRIYTRQKLQDVVAGYDPDTVNLNGRKYTVKRVSDFSNFGAGFYAVDCELQNLTGA